jgi:hypothetical protein
MNDQERVERAKTASQNWNPHTLNEDPQFIACLRNCYAEGYAAALYDATFKLDLHHESTDDLIQSDVLFQ